MGLLVSLKYTKPGGIQFVKLLSGQRYVSVCTDSNIQHSLCWRCVSELYKKRSSKPQTQVNVSPASLGLGSLPHALQISWKNRWELFCRSQELHFMVSSNEQDPEQVVKSSVMPRAGFRTNTENKWLTLPSQNSINKYSYTAKLACKARQNIHGWEEKNWQGPSCQMPSKLSLWGQMAKFHSITLCYGFILGCTFLFENNIYKLL